MLVVSSEHARSSAARLSISTLGQFIFRRDQSVELQSEVSDFGLSVSPKTSTVYFLELCSQKSADCDKFWYTKLRKKLT